MRVPARSPRVPFAPSPLRPSSFCAWRLALGGGWRSNDDTFSLLYLAPLALHTLPECEVEHVLDALARLGTALNKLCTDLLCDDGALFGGDRSETLCGEHALCVLVGTEINLGGHQQERGAFAEVRNLGVPLFNAKEKRESTDERV